MCERERMFDFLSLSLVLGGTQMSDLLSSVESLEERRHCHHLVVSILLVSDC